MGLKESSKKNTQPRSIGLKKKSKDLRKDTTRLKKEEKDPPKNPAGLKKLLKDLPASSGVYIMRGSGGEVLYIGKAKSLRPRVRSYFRTFPTDARYATRYLAARVADIESIVTTNEKEALMLEDTLLKKYRPRYNIRLKDDKTYLSIKITTKERFPKILTTRSIKKDGSMYFGPYASASMARETVKFLRRIFPLCVCSPSEFRNRARPCLDYQLGICSAPASGKISEIDYAALVRGAIMFLEGKNQDLVRGLKREMKAASTSLDYEEAAMIRDRIEAIEATLEEQKVVGRGAVDQDVFGVKRSEASLAVKVLFIREGRLVGGSDFFFADTLLPTEEIFDSFLTQYYRGERRVPGEIILPVKCPDARMIADWLGEKKGRKVRIIRPERGAKLKLMKMAELNAAESLKRRITENDGAEALVAALARRLRLKRSPRLIEAFDISNTGGTNAVGALVAFVDGKPDKERYRRFKIKTVRGADDYAMISEVLTRRYKTGKEMPDFVLIDGGKGQLAVAVAVFKELGIKGVSLAALAKDKKDGPGKAGEEKKSKGERVYMPNVKDPVYLKEGSKPDLLLRRIRDEVHRYAVTYHRKLRKKSSLHSVLDDIAGIGEKRKRALLLRFKDIEGISRATIEALEEVPGITGKLARVIKDVLSRNVRR